ncbi:MAG TPA: hypothetical protein VMY42_28715 [Thermoguttaceae bacterium]|nr:hypothetical protein [Thermoguttaceae bacterium]
MRKSLGFLMLGAVVCVAIAVAGCQGDKTAATDGGQNGPDAKSEVPKTPEGGAAAKTPEDPNKPKVVSKLIVNPLKGLFNRTFTKTDGPPSPPQKTPDTN